MTEKCKSLPFKPCDWHRLEPLGYLNFHADAERRKAKGQVQRQCPDCTRYYWPDEFGKKPKEKSNVKLR